MDAARVAAAERRGRGATNGTAAVAALQSYYVDAGVEAAWPAVANATAANHAAYAAAHGLPYARAAPAGARARCGKLRAVGAALADAPAGVGNGRDVPNFKGSSLGRVPLVSADSWTGDHPLERSRSVDAFFGTLARETLMLKRH